MHPAANPAAPALSTSVSPPAETSSAASSVLVAHTQAHALRQRLQRQPDVLLVACYCADWCRTCAGYRRGFEALAQRFPQHVFVWIDIEESPQLLDDDDVQDFPTLLLQQRGQTLFFGAQQPFTHHLEGLLRRSARLVPVQQRRPLVELLTP